jgi:hypothetical protein
VVADLDRYLAPMLNEPRINRTWLKIRAVGVKRAEYDEQRHIGEVNVTADRIHAMQKSNVRADGRCRATRAYPVAGKFGPAWYTSYTRYRHV